VAKAVSRGGGPALFRGVHALTQKEVEVEYRPTRFADFETVKELSGQRPVPVLIDGATVVYDSWKIATYLEDRFPNHPLLFEEQAGRAMTRLVNLWTDSTLHPPLR
jgi:glutathione S-transferase